MVQGAAACQLASLPACLLACLLARSRKFPACLSRPASALFVSLRVRRLARVFICTFSDAPRDGDDYGVSGRREVVGYQDKGSGVE